jgi:site-specific DNA-methyltransferase (adenine-specific)
MQLMKSLARGVKMSKHKIHHANIKEWAANYEGELFDAILCDPPYELGFMGKSWDSSGIAFDKDMWADLFKLVKPGGHLLAFSGSRTYHRMAVAIEDAGFEIRDMIEWVYGSGFPKSLNIGKAVDKIQGNEREELGFREDFVKRVRKNGVESKDYTMAGGWKADPTQVGRITKGTSEWEGYGTALKPAHEPCVLARKPLEGTVANNVLKHGTGGLNIDGTRVGTTGGETHKGGFGSGIYGDSKGVETDNTPTGRFPANLIHDGSDEVEAVFPQAKGMSGGGKHKQTYSKNGVIAGGGHDGNESHIRNDSGSASRFFYTAKASKSERNAGLEGFEKKVNKFGNQKNGEDIGNGSLNDKFTNAPSANHHPTVKPLSLTKYLATLIKPPTAGRILVPFSGSGSEMIGALQAGWGYVEGVELTEEYIPIAEARLAHWIDHEKSWTPQT